MNLVAAMRGEYRRSERLLWISISVKAVIYLATLGAAAWNNARAAALFLIFACVGQAFLFVCRVLMQGDLAQAERIRRLAMLQDGVGREPTPFELAILPESVWKPGEVTPATYYSSQLPKGSKRLVEVTGECAFFSGRIGATAWSVGLVLIGVASTLLLLSLILVIVLGSSQPRLEVIAKVVLIGITFWMTEDLIDMVIRYRRLANSCERILQECLRLVAEERPTLEDAYVVLHEYDSAVASAPPLPSRLYRRLNQQLTVIWQETRLRTMKAEGGSG